VRPRLSEEVRPRPGEEVHSAASGGRALACNDCLTSRIEALLSTCLVTLLLHLGGCPRRLAEGEAEVRPRLVREAEVRPRLIREAEVRPRLIREAELSLQIQMPPRLNVCCCRLEEVRPRLVRGATWHGHRHGLRPVSKYGRGVLSTCL
jgi:hypothetical protein